MKNEIKIAVTVLLLFFTFYLLGCFYGLSFDISEWSDLTRVFVSVVGGGTSLIIGITSNTFKD